MKARVSRDQFIDLGFQSGLTSQQIHTEMVRDREENGPFADEAPAAPRVPRQAPVENGRDYRNRMFREHGAEYAATPTMYDRADAGAPGVQAGGMKDLATSWSRFLMAGMTTPAGYAASKINRPRDSRSLTGAAPADVSAPQLPAGVPRGQPATQTPYPVDPDAYDPSDSFYGNFLHDLATGGGSNVANDPSLAAQFMAGGPTARATEAIAGAAGKYLPSVPGVGRVAHRGAQMAAEGAAQGVQQAGVNRAFGEEMDYLPSMAFGAGGNVVIGGVPYALGSVISFLRKGVQPTMEAVRPLTQPGAIDPAALRPDENGIQLSPAQALGERGGPRAAAEMTVQTDPVLGEYPRKLKQRNLAAMNETSLNMRQQFPDAPADLEGFQDVPAQRGVKLKGAARDAKRAIGQRFDEGMDEVMNQPAVAPDLGAERASAKAAYEAQGLPPEEVKTALRLQEGAGGKEFYRGHKVSRETQQPAAESRRQEFAQREGTLYQGEEELPADWDVADLGPDFATDMATADGAAPPERWVITNRDGDVVATGADRDAAVRTALEGLQGDEAGPRRPSLPDNYHVREDAAAADPGERWTMVWKDQAGNEYPLIQGATRENVLEQARSAANDGDGRLEGDWSQWRTQEDNAALLPGVAGEAQPPTRVPEWHTLAADQPGQDRLPTGWHTTQNARGVWELRDNRGNVVEEGNSAQGAIDQGRQMLREETHNGFPNNPELQRFVFGEDPPPRPPARVDDIGTIDMTDQDTGGHLPAAAAPARRTRIELDNDDYAQLEGNRWRAYDADGDVLAEGTTELSYRDGLREILRLGGYDRTRIEDYLQVADSPPPNQARIARANQQSESAHQKASREMEARQQARLPDGFSLKLKADGYHVLDDAGKSVGFHDHAATSAVSEAMERIRARKASPYEGDWKTPAKPFYSNLRKFFENEKQGAWGNGETLSKYLADKPGVKAEERKWTGLDLWLEGRKGKVTKAEVMDWLDQNEVKLEKVETREKDIEPPQALSEMGDTHDAWEPDLSEGGGYGVLTHHDKKNGIAWEYDGESNTYTATTRGKTFKGDVPGNVVTKIQRAFPDEFPSLSQSGGKGFKEYSMPGGKEYSEAKFTFPARQMIDRRTAFDAFLEKNPEAKAEPWAKRYKKFLGLGIAADFHSTHYREPNIAMHTRFQRADHAGEPATIWEEGQSDWVNKGREPGRGFMSLADLDEVDKKMAEHLEAANKALGESGAMSDEFLSAQSDIVSARHDFETKRRAGVPDMPFKGTGYAELAFKAMIRESAENGSKWLMWPEGKYQAERYGRATAGEEASGLVDLYDKTIPKYAAKYIKKWGGKLEKVMWDPGLNPGEMSSMDEGRLNRAGGAEEYLNDGVPDASAPPREGGPGFKMWAIRLPDEMVKAALFEGQPMFQRKTGDKGGTGLKGAYRKKTGEVTLFPPADFSTWGHEVLGHDFRTRFLKGDDEKPFVEWMESQGIEVADKKGNWTRKAEEAYARAIESMLFTGDAQVPKELKKPLARAAVAMKKLYEAGDLPEVTPAMKEAFGRTLTPKEIVAGMKQQVTATPTGPGEIAVENESQKALKAEMERFGADYDTPDADEVSDVTPDAAALVRKYVDKAAHAKTIKKILNLKRNLGVVHYRGQRQGLFDKSRDDVLMDRAYHALDETAKGVIRRELPKDLAEELVIAYEATNAEYSKNRKVLTELGKEVSINPKFDPTKATFYVTYKMKPDLLESLQKSASESEDMKPVWEQIQASFADGYLAKSLTTAGSSPNMWKLSPAKLIAEWNKIPEPTKKIMFEDGGEKWQRFLGRLSKLNIADADVFNPSGTARLQENMGFLKKLFSPADWSRAFAENYVKKLLLPRVEQYYTTGSAGGLGTVFDILDAAQKVEGGLKSRTLRTAVTSKVLADQDDLKRTGAEMGRKRDAR